eukprot:3949999-Prymnesium_polylepis.1
MDALYASGASTASDGAAPRVSLSVSAASGPLSRASSASTRSPSAWHAAAYALALVSSAAAVADGGAGTDAARGCSSKNGRPRSHT